MKEVYSRIDRSKELGFHVAEFPIEILKDFHLDKLNTLVNFNMEMEVSKGVAIVHLSVEVMYDESLSILSHNCIVEFLIGNLKEMVDDEGFLANEIWVELINETYSLVRGMINVRTLGFGIHDYPLPFLAYDLVMGRVEEILALRREQG